jgi:hypothetical protein
MGCAISNAGFANIGGPPRSAMGDPGPRVVDGAAGASVSCSVVGDDTFSISGSATLGDTSFTLTAGSVTAGGTGTAKIAVASPATAGKKLVSPDDTPCDLRVDRAPFQVASGLIWALFSCGLVSNPTQPGSSCGLTGEFLLENCEQ